MDGGETQQAALERAVRATALELLARRQTFDQLVATPTSLARTIATPPDRETAEAERKSQRMLAECGRLQPTLGLSTTTRVARRFARDKPTPWRCAASRPSCAAGQRVSFEIGEDRDGRKHAVNIQSSNERKPEQRWYMDKGFNRYRLRGEWTARVATRRIFARMKT
jgi:hypothetical protein